MKRQVYLFTGPTGYQLAQAGSADLAAADLQILPPAQRGDITALTIAHVPGVIAVVDGRFGDVLAVGHHELMAAAKDGWQVWGLGSMGAIRAAELNGHGVHGYGRAYEYFTAHMAPDDHVALLHGPPPNYRPLTEALIDLRSYLDQLTGEGILTRRQAGQAIEQLANRWFGCRTPQALIQACRHAAGTTTADQVHRRLGDLPRCRVKAADLRNFLTERPWTA